MPDQPLIDSARLKFSGISSEDFEDIPEIGESRVYTIRAQCTKHIEEQMANEGTRKIANMKIEKILTGVTEKIREDGNDQPNLFDSEPDPDPEDEGATVHEFTGPSFSAGDE